MMSVREALNWLVTMKFQPLSRNVCTRASVGSESVVIARTAAMAASRSLCIGRTPWFVVQRTLVSAPARATIPLIAAGGGVIARSLLPGCTEHKSHLDAAHMIRRWRWGKRALPAGG